MTYKNDEQGRPKQLFNKTVFQIDSIDKANSCVYLKMDGNEGSYIEAPFDELLEAKVCCYDNECRETPIEEGCKYFECSTSTCDLLYCENHSEQVNRDLLTSWKYKADKAAQFA